MIWLRRALALLGNVHRLGTVAIAAFKGIVGFEPFPFVRSKLKALVEELLARADGAKQPPPDLLGGLHLARHLVSPIVRHMTIGAGGAHAGAVRVVNG